jgi:hypothetical protein
MKALGLALWLAAAPVFACGFCVEDKIAACYDHAVVTSAKARGHAVAFFAIHGDLPRNKELHAALKRELEQTRGVEPGTARVSLENSALSFAYAGGKSRLGSIQRSVGRRMAQRGYELQLLRVMGPA